MFVKLTRTDGVEVLVNERNVDVVNSKEAGCVIWFSGDCRNHINVDLTLDQVQAAFNGESDSSQLGEALALLRGALPSVYADHQRGLAWKIEELLSKAKGE